MNYKCYTLHSHLRISKINHNNIYQCSKFICGWMTKKNNNIFEKCYNVSKSCIINFTRFTHYCTLLHNITDRRHFHIKTLICGHYNHGLIVKISMNLQLNTVFIHIRTPLSILCNWKSSICYFRYCIMHLFFHCFR